MPHVPHVTGYPVHLQYLSKVEKLLEVKTTTFGSIAHDNCTKGPFKLTNYSKSFPQKKCAKDTELSQNIWALNLITSILTQSGSFIKRATA